MSLRAHSGRYTITAKNKSGQKHVNVRVNVLGTAVISVWALCLMSNSLVVLDL